MLMRACARACAASAAGAAHGEDNSQLQLYSSRTRLLLYAHTYMLLRAAAGAADSVDNCELQPLLPGARGGGRHRGRHALCLLEA
jgi:hypothetical protein